MSIAGIAPGSIVVGVDGSPDAARAIQWAAEQGHREKRPLALLHGSPLAVMSAYPGAEYLILDSATLASFADAARSVLAASAAVAHEAAPGLDVRTLEIAGSARQALLEVSAQAHLVVVGSRGRGHAAGALLGSVSAALAAHAECPVVVVPPPAAGARIPAVVVGARFAPGTVPVVEHAFAQASLRGLPLTVMHCYLDTVYAEAPVRAPAERTGLEREREQLAEAVAGLAEKYPDVVVDLDLTTGLFTRLLTDATRVHDLVVIGRRTGSLLHRSIGRWSTLSIVENAAGVVVVVPESTR